MNKHNHNQHLPPNRFGEERNSNSNSNNNNNNDNNNDNDVVEISARSKPIHDNREYFEEHQAETDNVVDLFSTTLRSLAADAAAIRQITNMADLLKQCQQQQQQDDCEYDGSAAKAVADQLIELDDLVTGVEHKVVVLRQIINEEKNAVYKFETFLREEADEQASLIKGLMEALELKEKDEMEVEMKIEMKMNKNKMIADEIEYEYENENDDEHDHVNNSDILFEEDDEDDEIQQLQQHQQQQQETQTEISVSSLGSSNIHNSYRQSMAGSWEEPISTPTTQRRSVGSTGSSIRSNESGSFTRRNGLLRCRNFSNANHSNDSINSNYNCHDNCNDNYNDNCNDNCNDNYKSPRHHMRRDTMKKTATPHNKRIISFQDETNDTKVVQHKDDDNDNNVLERPSFVPVTEQELEKDARFGPHINISRYDMNEALVEIQNVFWNMDSLKSNRSSRNSSFGGVFVGNSSNNINKRHSSSISSSIYGDRRNSGHNSQTLQQPTTRFAVSEQELRENCAFFGHGELTARSILQRLCSLKRLKQVPNKNAEVTYVCLFGV